MLHRLNALKNLKLLDEKNLEGNAFITLVSSFKVPSITFQMKHDCEWEKGYIKCLEEMADMLIRRGILKEA